MLRRSHGAETFVHVGEREVALFGQGGWDLWVGRVRGVGADLAGDGDEGRCGREGDAGDVAVGGGEGGVRGWVEGFCWHFREWGDAFVIACLCCNVAEGECDADECGLQCLSKKIEENPSISSR